MKMISTSPSMLALTLMLTISAMSCKDDKKEPEQEQTKITFADKEWKTATWDLVVPLDLDDNGTKETDLMQVLEPCDVDDFIVFKKDGRFITNTGALQCNETEEQELYSSNWTYDEAAKVIHLKSVSTGLEKDDYEVLEHTESTLKVRFNILPEDGKNPAIKSVMLLKKK
jgi:hypothetical protein